MAITGNLETMSLAELLQWLANGRQTGTLIVNYGSVEKKIFLRDGAVLSSSSVSFFLRNLARPEHRPGQNGQGHFQCGAEHAHARAPQLDQERRQLSWPVLV